MNKKTNTDWWKQAVFYQIYPRSFMDANGDGTGDLPGITGKLDYVAALGVEGIWLSPFFKSPMADFGYDVSDYRAVDPLFGTLEDFDRLLDKAHKLGLKIIIDQVLSHTSKQHAWFQESRQSADNPKADWYVWADAKPGGMEPNNWRSVFGGPAWSFDTRRGQYYMHNFLSEQPDLNVQNPAVQDALLAECRFWLERGVDGFRLDAVNFICHDPLLRDNPAKDPLKGDLATQFSKPDPYSMQYHVYDKSRPEALAFLQKFRRMMDGYPGTMTLAEIGDDYPMKTAALYTADNDKFNTAYNFSLMSGKAVTASVIRNAVEEFFREPGGGWPSWAMSNHDVVRVVSRWKADPKLMIALLCSLPGAIFLYQGEELGLPEAEIPYERLQDPWGKYLWPEWQGRDGCRTPMPWTDGANAGFSTAQDTWLPVPPEHLPLSVARQEADKTSTLHFTRAFLEWRKGQPALLGGRAVFHDTGSESVLAFTRESEGGKMLCVFNLGGAAADVRVPVTGAKDGPSLFDKPGAGDLSGGRIALPPYGFYFGSLSG